MSTVTLAYAPGRNAPVGLANSARSIRVLVLVATFEVVFALHTAVERVGRYIQVFHEGDAAPGTPHAWQASVMATAFNRSWRPAEVNQGQGWSAQRPSYHRPHTRHNSLSLPRRWRSSSHVDAPPAAHRFFVVNAVNTHC